MYLLLAIFLFISEEINLKPTCTLAKDTLLSTNMNAILLKCPNDRNKDWPCEPQLIININFTPNLNVDNVDKLLILDETYEPISRRSFKIMSPYIISITRSQPIIMFPLQSSNWTTFDNISENLGSYADRNLINNCKAKKKTRHANEQNLQDRKNVVNSSSKCDKQKIDDGLGKTSQESYEKETITSEETCGANKNFRTVKETGEPGEYSIYNLNAPFPYLAAKIRIFRKRKNTWWKIVPSVTLNNLSGTLINGNLSILLTSHDDILHTRTPVYLENHKLLIPKNYFTHSEKLDELQVYKNIILDFFNHNSNNIFTFDNANDTKKFVNIRDNTLKKPKVHENSQNGRTKINDLDKNAASINILDKCPYNNKTLCLNIVDDRVPAYSIKIKMPFRENAAQKNVMKVKLSRIISDATTKDALQISVDVINKGLEAQEFYISIANCPLSETEATTTVKKMLLPYISETITFLLPFIMATKKPVKFSCDVIAQANILQKEMYASSSESFLLAVSKRSVDIETHSRCFCIWNCRCHCIGKIETHVDVNVCQRMSNRSEKDAGLLLNCPPNNDSDDFCLTDLNNENQINQPVSGTFRRVVVVMLILILILFLLSFFCCKCFIPRKEDLLVASTEWYCCPEPKCSVSSRDSSRSLSPVYIAKKHSSKSIVKHSGELSLYSSIDVPCNNHQIDSLESALVTLTRQQKELRRHSVKKE